MSKNIDRELFTTRYIKHLYQDAIYLGDKRWLQSPNTIKTILNILKLNKTDKVLEIGCSSGYQASMFSQLCEKVVTLDCDKVLLKEADKIFADLKIDNIETKYIRKGINWKIKERFNYIIVSMAIEVVPNNWFEQLLEGGLLIAPIIMDNDYQVLTKFYKKNGEIIEEEIEQCSFVGMQDIIDDCKSKHKFDIRFWI